MFTINNHRGFTIVEILVALSILSLVIFSFSPLISNSFSNIFTAGRKSNALYQAQKQMENKFAQGTTEDTSIQTISFPYISDEISVKGKQEQVTYSYEGHSGTLIAFITNKN